MLDTVLQLQQECWPWTPCKALTDIDIYLLKLFYLTRNGSSSLVQCGVSVAPISKWEYHNSLYTERYMGFPSLNDNWEGYNEADLTKLVTKKMLF